MAWGSSSHHINLSVLYDNWHFYIGNSLDGKETYTYEFLVRIQLVEDFLNIYLNLTRKDLGINWYVNDMLDNIT